ncbi:hypothetical protein PIB30_056195 [Stylosanthes scabra]|uniref:Uncharacterized protein n=1 Tax=Stylosanthes scabra TaxID=79078 RepID=A0ABU6WJB1_9FABA|nr:hypothetical protein [Stylosanthes scabra]
MLEAYLMGSGVIYYEYEKHEKFEDYELKADAELQTFKIRRYHFDDESFVHLLHDVKFDPDREVFCSRVSFFQTVEFDATLLTEKVIINLSSSFAFSSVVSSSLRRRVAGKTLRPPKSSELIPPSEGWMCEEDEEEKEIGGMEPSVEKEKASKKEEKEEDSEEEEEEDPVEEFPASTSLLMDIDATGDYLQFIEELERHPGYSPIHSGQPSVPDSPEDRLDRRSDSYGALSYDLSEVWAPPSSGLSL